MLKSYGVVGWWWGGCPWDFSVSPRPLGLGFLGFGAKGLGRLGLFHHVLVYTGDLQLVHPALNLSTLDTGILIMVQYVSLIIFSLNMVNYPMSFLLLSSWNFFCWTSTGDHSKMFLLFELCCGTPHCKYGRLSEIIIMLWMYLSRVQERILNLNGNYLVQSHHFNLKGPIRTLLNVKRFKRY